MRIALLSDTHVPTSLPRLPEDLVRQIEGSDAILHAGDLVSLSVVERLEAIAPLFAVVGNCDPREVREALPGHLRIELAGHSIGLHHGHQPHRLQRRYIGLDYQAPEMQLFYRTMRDEFPDVETIVFGHFHAPLVMRWEDCLFVNPGAVTPTFGRSTFALLSLDDDMAVEIRDVTLARADFRAP